MSGAGLAAPFSFKGGSYPGTGGSCNTTLAGAGATCTIVVVYAPGGTGAHADTIEIAYNDGAGGQQATRDLAGTGANPAALSISDGATFDYGPLANTASADKTFTITNTGGVSATSVGGSGLAAPFAFKGVGTYPGTGGTCGVSLGVGSSCTIVVTFNPTVNGSFNDTIDIGFNDGASAQTSSRDVTGSGAPEAVITISDGATYDFGTLAQNGTANKSFTLTNSGGVTASSMAGTGLAAPYSYAGGAYPGTGGTCGATLAGTLTCTIVVTYNPTTVATHTDTIDINYNDGLVGRTTHRDLTGTAVTAATLTISDGATYDYGLQATGTTHEKTFTVTNTGTFAASSVAGTGLAAPFAFKGGTYPGTGGTCDASLNGSNSTCTIVVTYAPSTTGAHSDSIEINYNNGASAQQSTRALAGTGAAPALLTLSDGPAYAFGGKANGSTTEKTVMITNSGGVSATSLTGGGLAAPYSFKGGGYPGTGGSCSTTLAASASCSIIVVFAPSSTNSYADTIEIGYNDGVAVQQATRDLTGSSTPPATLTVSDGATYDYGTIITGSSTDKSFTITNTGNFTASTIGGSGLAAPFGFKDTTFPGTGGTCGATLAPAGTCTVIVTFNPTVSTTYNDTMDITYNDGVTTQVSSRPLAGAGGPPANITISDGATYSFGAVAQGSTHEKTFTLNNIGGASATSMAGAGLSAPYSFKGGSFPGTGGTCTGGTLTGSSSCTMVVVYTPTTVATHNATIQINYYDGASAQQSTRAVTGSATAPASLAISDGATYDYGINALTKVSEKTFTITNNGDFSASAMTGTGISAPFVFKGGAYPGTGGTCNTALAPSTSCTVIVTYTPTSTGTHSGTFDINYNNGASAQLVQRGVTGVGATVALLAVSDGATYNFGTRAIGLNAEKQFTVTNSGGITATGMSGGGISAPFAYKGAGYPGTGGDCGTTLAPAGTCTIVVVFTPSTSGVQNSTIEIAYNDGLTVQSADRAVQGTGADPASLTISDGPTYNFGNLQTGFTSDKTLTINNTGGVSATGVGGSGLASPYSFKGGSYPGGGTCGNTIAPSTNCTVIVTFAPLSTGVANDTADISYNNAITTQTVSRDLTGTGVAPAAPTSLTKMSPAGAAGNVTSVTIRVAGVTENNVVKLFTDNSCSTEVANGTVSIGGTTIDLVWSPIPVDGAYTFYANRTNSAGTTSSCSAATASYTLDTTPPVLTTLVNQVPGRSPHWNTTPTLRATGTFASDTVTIYSNSGCTTTVTSSSATGASVDIVLPTISAQGTYNYYAKAADAVGNATSCVGPVVYNYDVTDITVAFSSFSQIVNEDTTVSVPLVMSATKPYATTMYYKTHGTTVDGVNTTGLDASGSFVIPANTTNYNFEFTAANNMVASKDRYVDIVLYDTSYEYIHAAGRIYHRVLIKDDDSSIVAAKALPAGNGYATSCFVDGNEKLFCVGANTYGNVGDGTTTDRVDYVAVDASTNYKQVSIGRNHACGLTAAGDVKCWGSDQYGQLGDGVVNPNMSTPQTVTSLGSGNKAIAAGGYFNCAINASDKLYCWGRNNVRQIGDNTTTTRATPVAIDSSNTYTKVAMGEDHTCAIRSDGALFCWGSGQTGAVGNDSTANTAQGPLYNVLSGTAFMDITAITNANKLWCWGENSNGQLGKGNTTDTGTPAAVDVSTDYAQIAAGRLHTCGVTTAGAMRCAGNNAYGQHFDRTAEQVTTFYAVGAGLTFGKVASFEDSTWGQLTNGEVYYAGSDTLFAFSGDGTTTLVKTTPAVIDDAKLYSKLDQGWGERATCAIYNNKIRCAGASGTEGILGLGSEPLIAGFVYVDPKNDYLQVASGRNHTCALRSNNKLFCAGAAAQAGTGVLTNLLTAVDSANDYSFITVGYQHSCGILTSGALKCWGTGANGRLGQGGTGNLTTPTTIIDSGTSYAFVSAGLAHTCGITTGGVLKCWGAQNEGRLGNGATGSANVTSPTIIDSGTSYLTVSAGENHSCGITTTNVLKCWGAGANGKLGTGGTGNQGSPVVINSGTNYIDVATASTSTCAINASGTMRCAGQWIYGISGATDLDHTSFVDVDSGIHYTEVIAKRYAMCAKDNVGQTRCWGNNFYNTFGNTENNWFPDAVPVPGFNQ
ncbi:MAG TPA: choice-of-anchor D domain-containing protein [Bdellovibrionales bacterium]|nr:choice-of-anchor D domain-containing protein [Bdellovibrionales bacterium]